MILIEAVNSGIAELGALPKEEITESEYIKGRNDSIRKKKKVHNV